MQCRNQLSDPDIEVLYSVDNILKNDFRCLTVYVYLPRKSTICDANKRERINLIKSSTPQICSTKFSVVGTTCYKSNYIQTWLLSSNEMHCRNVSKNAWLKSESQLPFNILKSIAKIYNRSTDSQSPKIKSINRISRIKCWIICYDFFTIIAVLWVLTRTLFYLRTVHHTCTI